VEEAIEELKLATQALSCKYPEIVAEAQPSA
jgi:hypothetical protein